MYIYSATKISNSIRQLKIPQQQKGDDLKKKEFHRTIWKPQFKLKSKYDTYLCPHRNVFSLLFLKFHDFFSKYFEYLVISI